MHMYGKDRGQDSIKKSKGKKEIGRHFKDLGIQGSIKGKKQKRI